MNRDDLVRSLVLYTASGKLDAQQALPAVRNLLHTGAPPPAMGEVIDALVAEQRPELQALATQLGESRRLEAVRHYSLKRTGKPVPEALRSSLSDLPLDVPVGWTNPEDAAARLRAAMTLLEDRCLLAERRDDVPQLATMLDRELEKAADAAFEGVAAWGTSSLLDLVAAAELRSPVPTPVKEGIAKQRDAAIAVSAQALAPGGGPTPPASEPDVFLTQFRTAFAQATTREERRRLLDLLCACPDDAAGSALLTLELEPGERDRAAMILTLRFGQAAAAGWTSWAAWLRSRETNRQLQGNVLRALAHKRPLVTLLLWYSRRADADDATLRQMEKECAASLGPAAMDDFIERWAGAISPEEERALTGAEAPPARVEEPAPAVIETRKTPAPVAIPAPKPKVSPRPAPPPRPPSPSIWEVHLKPFFLDNWYMVAGVVMVVVGSSLLAYYTWDKTWLVRYSLMPTLLAAFTAALAWMGGWIERKDAQFKGTGAVLRSAAIGLLPVNFMAVALLVGDKNVLPGQKMLAVPLMAAIYLGLFGWGLRKWCSAVHPALGGMLGGTLLFLNALVTLGPIARPLGPAHVLPVVGAGFYLGFLALSAAVVRFARRVLTAELAKEKRVVWFFGAALAVTFVQVFAWAHGQLQHIPHPHTYAPMVVLTGWLVLFTERRTLELRGGAERLGAESFLGYAFILLGVLLGIGHDVMRLVTFALAGAVWIYQSLPRRQPLQHWIGLTFVALAGASIGLLHGFPPAVLPFLGIGVALLMGAIATLARRDEILSRAATGMQAAVLFISLPAAVLAHWHFGTPRLETAGAIASVAALFGWRAWRDRQIAWVHTAMVVLAVALPYLTETFQPTFLVAGLAALSFLWIGLVASVRSPLLLNSRSTVLWIYGVLAVVCMAARVELDHHAIVNPGLDLGGPVLMMAALLFAAYFSRSLVPSGMAMAIGILLLPVARAPLQKLFPELAWGSGLGSAATAVGFALLCFALQRWPRLKELGEGDRHLGRDPFPLRRLDSSLFTWPLLAAALFLAFKVDTWNFLSNLDGPHLEKMSIAIGLTGVFWTLFAVHVRDLRGAKAATYVGLAWMSASLMFVTHLWGRSSGATILLVPALFVQALFFLHRFVLERRAAWVADLLTGPTRRFLRLASLLLSTGCFLALVWGKTPLEVQWLALFAGTGLVWHGLASRHLHYGTFLLALTWVMLLAWTAPGSGLLAERLSMERSLTPTLLLLLGIQMVQGVLELRKAAWEFLKPLVVPFQATGVLLAVALGIAGVLHGFDDLGFAPAQLALLLGVVLLTARAMTSGPLALLGALLAYTMAHAGVPAAAREAQLLSPWHASLLALAMALLGHAGRRLHSKQPALLSGALTPDALRWPVVPWLFGPAAAIACGIALYHAAVPALRDAPVQAWAPYVGALTLGVIAASTGRLWIAHAAGVLVTLGNVHLVRVFGGKFLLDHGLTEIHLIGLGVALTLLQLTTARRLVRREELARMAARASLAWAGLVLALISANYLVDPNLAKIDAFRFGVSGAMSLLAGFYFRRAARRPVPGEEPYAKFCEGFYHFGVTMAIWCAALMVPVLRHPVTALVSLGLPVLYFYARAESGFRRGAASLDRYRASAATLACLVLALYVLRPILQLVIFPNNQLELVSYHRNSPVLFVLGMVLLRLRALGASNWLAFYGGLAVMVSLYFAVTALPGLSPFDHPVESAWAAIALAHVFTFASVQRSPLRTAIQRLAGIDAQEWQALRRPWGVCLLAASQGMALWGILGYEAHPLMVAPLLVGAASVFVHQGILRGSTIYPIVARVQVLVALHMGFVLKSYLASEYVAWALLVIWAALLAIDGWTRMKGMTGHAAALWTLTLGHVLFWHHPGSPAGLWAMGLASLLAALTPRDSRAPESWAETLASAALPWTPAWLVWFGQSRAGAPLAWPVLATAATILATGALASVLQKMPSRVSRLRPRLFDQSIAWLGASGATVRTVALSIATLATAAVQAAHLGEAFAPRELALIEALYAALSVGWFLEGRARKAMAPYFLLQACLLGAFLVARTQLQLAHHAWDLHYDVWASLVAFFACIGLKQVLENQPRQVLVPLHLPLLALPLFSVSWSVLHHLGSGMELTVVGLHSAAFAYLGKEDRESPYHFVAIGGFVAFVMMIFWQKLHLEMIYAYVVPVGVGVLVLLQLFAKRVPTEARNGIRAVTLVAMVGSAGYYALVDRHVPLLHNMTVMVLCLGAMALGSLLRIRMYLALGFGALMVDLAALFIKVVAFLDRSTKMTMIGIAVLVIGSTLIFGAIYFKTHKKEIAERLARWRLKFAGWE